MTHGMRVLFILLALTEGPVASLAQTADERGATAAASARGVFGTQEGLVTNGIEPFSNERPMRTVDGQAFQAALACEASQQFLRVTMFPAGSDISRFVVELDGNLDGAVDSATNFSGPFAGVCNNGVIRCAAGTWENCHFLQWDTSSGTLALTEVGQQQLGACYCFNASCGNNLLLVNSQKVVSDLGTSVLTAAQQLLPRVASTRTVADALSIQFIGQRGGCGVDESPEQFFRRPNDMAAAGLAAMSVPGSVANFISSTAVARGRGISTMRCEINRNIGANEIRKSDILNFLSATRGYQQDCGPGCIRFLLGQAGNNYYGDNERCTVYNEALRLEVLRPDRITSFNLYRVTYDDHIVLAQNGAVLYSRIHSLDWPDPVNGLPRLLPRPGFSCERSDNWDLAPNVNLLPALQTVGTHELRLRTAVGGEGDAALYMEARVNEACEIGAEEIIDGCVAAAGNTRCRLRNEWVDGVQTVSEYLTTGLGPLPSSRNVGTSCTINSGNRAWWRTEREYDCRTEETPMDLSAMAERYDSIHQSIDLTSGAFTDRVRNPDGTYETVGRSIPVLAERGTDACVPTCRTRRLRPGSNVATSGPTTVQNVTGVAYDFSFKECESGACPLVAGEEVVGACDCRNNFGQAVAMMQTIRMVAEDTSCEVPE